jgi:hypothetical protein
VRAPSAKGDGQGWSAEEARKGGVAHVQAAGVGAEGGQDQPLLIGDEAAAAHACRPSGDARTGVKVAGDLAVLRVVRRLVD